MLENFRANVPKENTEHLHINIDSKYKFKTKVFLVYV